MVIIYLLLVLMIVIWSFSFIIVDIAIEIIPPLSLALYRFIVASMSFIIIDIYFKLNRKKGINENTANEKKAKISKNEWLLIVLASFTGGSVFFLAQYTAIQLIGPSLPALFVCLLAPVIIAILSLLFFNEKLNSIKIIGFIIATIGAFLLVTGGDVKTFTPAAPNYLGYLFALMTPLLWAIYSTITKKLMKNKSTLEILKYVSYIGTIEIFLFVLINNEFLIFVDNFLNIILFLCALYLGLGCYVIGYYIWQDSQKELKSSNVASFLYIEPFLTLFFSFLLQRRETIILWNILGGIIVLFAVLIINYNNK